MLFADYNTSAIATAKVFMLEWIFLSQIEAKIPRFEYVFSILVTIYVPRAYIRLKTLDVVLRLHWNPVLFCFDKVLGWRTCPGVFSSKTWVWIVGNEKFYSVMMTYEGFLCNEDIEFSHKTGRNFEPKFGLVQVCTNQVENRHQNSDIIVTRSSRVITYSCYRANNEVDIVLEWQSISRNFRGENSS